MVLSDSQPTHYRILNWRAFQHYSDRNPPWVKLHAELLTSRDWVMLSDASRVLVVACMLIASRSGVNGAFPNDPAFIERAAYLNSPPDFEPLVKCGFLEPYWEQSLGASALQADTRPETEVEEEIEEEKRENFVHGSTANHVLSPVRLKPKSEKDEIREFATSTGFLDWWGVYPRKEARIEAEKAWTFDLTKSDRPLMVDRIHAWLRLQDEHYRINNFSPDHPLGANWIRDCRWEDE